MAHLIYDLSIYQLCQSIANKKSRTYGTSDRPVRSVRESDLSESQICQRVRSVRPCGRPWESEVRGRKWEAVGGQSDSHCWPALRVHPWASRTSTWSARGSDSQGRPAVGGRSDSHGLPLSASHFGLSDRSHDFVCGRPIGLSCTPI